MAFGRKTKAATPVAASPETPAPVPSTPAGAAQSVPAPASEIREASFDDGNGAQSDTGPVEIIRHEDGVSEWL